MKANRFSITIIHDIHFIIQYMNKLSCVIFSDEDKSFQYNDNIMIYKLSCNIDKQLIM